MELSFGARLRAQREQQQVSLTAISAATKIKVGLLEGLEADEVSHWPNGLFRRSYVRDYARAIGLDPEATVREESTSATPATTGRTSRRCAASCCRCRRVGRSPWRRSPTWGWWRARR